MIEKFLLFISGLLVGLLATFIYRRREQSLVMEEIKEISMANVIVLEKILDLLETLLVELTSCNGGVKNNL